MLKKKWTDLSKKRKIAFFVFLVLSAIWMCVIFSFSADDAETSSSYSGRVTEKIVRVVDSEYEHPQKVKNDTFEFFAERVVRKAAHFMCYTFLAILFFFMFGALFGVPLNKKIMTSVTAFVAGILYASFDEFHQTFVEGRFGSALDVLIDAGGALFGILLCLACCAIYLKTAKK